MKRVAKWFQRKWRETFKPKSPTLTRREKTFESVRSIIIKKKFVISSSDLEMLKGLQQDYLFQVLKELTERRIVPDEKRKIFDQIVLNGCLEYFRIKSRGEGVIPVERKGISSQDPLNAYLQQYIPKHTRDII